LNRDDTDQVIMSPIFDSLLQIVTISGANQKQTLLRNCAHHAQSPKSSVPSVHKMQGMVI
jgi:hypothetical protein